MLITYNGKLNMIWQLVHIFNIILPSLKIFLITQGYSYIYEA